MDVFLTEETHRSLDALSIVGGSHDGLLLGHKRGHRFFVEKIFPTQKGFFSSLEHYLGLNRHFEDRVIGFFSLNPDDRKANKILVPFAQGKLYLSVRSTDEGTLVIRPYCIDYKGKFYLSPIRLKSRVRR